MRQVGRSVQCRQNRRGRTAATWPSSVDGPPRKDVRPSPDYLASEADYAVPLSSAGKHWTFRPVRCVRRSPSRAIPLTLYATAAW